MFFVCCDTDSISSLIIYIILVVLCAPTSLLNLFSVIIIVIIVATANLSHFQISVILFHQSLVVCVSFSFLLLRFSLKHVK